MNIAHFDTNVFTYNEYVNSSRNIKINNYSMSTLCSDEYCDADTADSFKINDVIKSGDTGSFTFQYGEKNGDVVYNNETDKFEYYNTDLIYDGFMYKSLNKPVKYMCIFTKK